MIKRRIILLKIKENYYKFLSIFYTNLKDSSYYLYNHVREEKTPLYIAEPFHLLKSSGNFSTDGLKKEISNDTQNTHISIHPTRIYLKKRTEKAEEKHLIEETEPQGFNKDGFRLHCLFTPAPPNFLPSYNLSKKIKEIELVVFEWNSEFCPQISIYELNKSFDTKNARSILPEYIDMKIIPSDGTHPSICLHLRATEGDVGIWQSNSVVFGKIINKKSISKPELQKIISYNNASFDISDLPDNAIISNYKVLE